MTAANGKLLAREHSLVQGAYELSALAQKGEGSPTGETFEVIFQGNEGDALEVFSGYKVTDENGDGMTYYKKGRSMKSKEGFTLLEPTSFFLSAQWWLYGRPAFWQSADGVQKHMQLYQAESMGDAAAFKITSRLSSLFLFSHDPGKDDVLYYLEGEDWNSLTQEDIDQVSAGDYRVKLDFSDTEPEIAVVYITILYKEEEIHTRK